MAGNDDEGLLTFLKANTPLNNTEVKGGSVLAEFRPFFNVAVPQLLFFFFFFLNESTFIPTSLRSLD